MLEKQIIKLYKIESTYSDPYFKSYWSLRPSDDHNATHGATGLKHDDYTDDGPIEFVLPDGYEIGETVTGEVAVFDDRGSHASVETLHGKPYLLTGKGYIRLEQR